MEDDDIDFCFSIAEGIVWSIENLADAEVFLQHHNQSYSYPVEIRLLCYVAKEWYNIVLQKCFEFPKIILSYVKYIYSTY